MTTTAVPGARPAQDDSVDLAAIRRLAYKIARDTTDKVDADDLAQEAMARYWLEFGTKRQPINRYGWLLTTIRRLSMDHERQVRGRHGQRQAPVVLDLTDGTIGQHPHLMATSPSRRVIAADTRERVLAHLSPRDRRVFELRLDGIPARRVAARLGLTPAAVDQIFRRARRRLAEAVGSELR